VPRLHGSSRCVLAAFACAFSACSDPPDDTPLGRDIAAIMARPEQTVDKVKVQHVLLAFVGAKRGSESKRTYAEARTLTEELLKRARDGEDFATLMQKYSSDEGGGTYTLTQADRYDYAQNFHQIAFRLAVGEIGVAAHHPSKSPFGWHVIKRLE
jgi:parvulin-like peptidyl-prolyl isomerase